MPEIIQFGTKGSELTYQQLDEQVAAPGVEVTGNINLDSTYNREVLNVTAASTITVQAAATLEAALDVTDTGGEAVGWWVDIFNNVADTSGVGNVTIAANSQTINGATSDITINRYESGRLTYHPASNAYSWRAHYSKQANWTPTLQGSSVAGTPGYTTRAGYYHVQGDLVTIWCEVELSSKVGVSGNVLITGIPYPSHAVNSINQTLSPVSQLANHNLTGPETIVPLLLNASDSIQLNYVDSVSGEMAIITDADITGTFHVRFAGTYLRSRT